MRTWVKSLADHRCAFCGGHIRNGDLMELLELKGVQAKYHYCREHAHTAIPLDVPALPTEIEFYTMGDMERIRHSRERMTRIGELGKSVDWKAKQLGEREPGSDD